MSTLKTKIAIARMDIEKRRNDVGEFRKLTIKEKFWNWVNESRFVQGITMLALGASWMAVYFLGIQFYNEIIPMRNKTIIIRNNFQTPKVKEAKETKIEEVKEKIETTGQFSAYNAEVGQTDSDPFTMASGKKVYEGAIANNCLKFGTKIKVNGVIKIVEDRMNSRYGCNNFDIFMNDHDEAIRFGRKEMVYEVLIN
jgi:3D (Asp-Asp-Asp) domain-containing protein